MEDFKQLSVWRKAHVFALAVYRATRHFPKHELFGLSSQLRRCATSIPANIAEGCGRRSDGELARFVQIARGSASEAEYHLLLARDLELLAPAEYRQLASEIAEIERMLAGLSQAVNSTMKRRAPAERKFAAVAKS